MEIYTPEQIAEVLSVNVQTVRKWLRRGEMMGADTPAGWRVTRAELEAWLDQYRKPRPQQPPVMTP